MKLFRYILLALPALLIVWVLEHPAFEFALNLVGVSLIIGNTYPLYEDPKSKSLHAVNIKMGLLVSLFTLFYAGIISYVLGELQFISLGIGLYAILVFTYFYIRLCEVVKRQKPH